MYRATRDDTNFDNINSFFISEFFYFQVSLPPKTLNNTKYEKRFLTISIKIKWLITLKVSNKMTSIAFLRNVENYEA